MMPRRAVASVPGVKFGGLLHRGAPRSIAG